MGELIPHLDQNRPLTTLFLPEWLMRSLSGLIADSIPARIPESLAPTTSQRMLIQIRIDEFEKLEAQRDVDRAAVRVSEMLTAFGQAHMSEKVATMRARAYLTALEDLPWWAIEEACRQWLMGEAGDYNYSFAPSPPQLRIVAIGCRDRVVNQRKALQRLLNARVEKEYSAEHRGEMLAKLADLFRSIGAAVSRAPAKRPLIARTPAPAVPTDDELRDRYKPQPAEQAE